MCQTKSQGGKRCAAHARPAYQSVMADIGGEPARGQTRADFDDDLAYRVDHGMDAIIDYAATPTGADAVQKDLALLTEQYDRHPSSSIKHETVRQGTLSALRVAVRQAEARNAAAVTAREVNDRYSELFHDRIRLQNQIHERQLTVEDSADAHAVNEMQLHLDAINDEMESMETWRRTPPAPIMFGSGNGKTSSIDRSVGIALNDLRSPEAVATASDEDGAADRMAWEDARGGPPEPNVDEDGYEVDDHGNAWGVCEDCGTESAKGGFCCPDSQVVPVHEMV